MRRTAYTLAEVVVVVLIMGVMAAIALPRLPFDSITRRNLPASTYKLVGDLRKTRSLALSDAATNHDGYRLRMLGSSPYSEYLIRNIDTGEEVYRADINGGITVTTSPTYRFVFGPLGNMTLGGNSQITLTADGKSYTITFTTDTGAVLCTKN